jgi:cell division protein FtsI/penicillin-binding protein 2
MTEGPRRRLKLVAAVLIGLVVMLVAQLAQVQIVDQDFYKGWAKEQRERIIAIADPPRGVIRDRDGRLMAGNEVMYSIEADPVYVVDATGVAVALAPLLHMPAAEIEQWLRSDVLWAQIASPVSKETGEQVADLGLQGIKVKPLWARAYPENSLASHVIGFCNVQGTGFYGVEGFYDAELQPKKVEYRGPVDPASEQVPWTVAPVVLPKAGDELILTLDRTVQALVEDELMRAVQEYGAQGGTIIVMDPRTFELLAVASLPNYDPDRYNDFYVSDPPPFEDPAVSKLYEPGSVFKVVTVAAALDAGLVTPESTYYDPGWIEVGGVTIRNSSGEGGRDFAVSDVLIHSLNVGAAWLSTRMGPETFYRYVLAFGFGRPTGIDLSGEAAGQVWLPGDYVHWHDSNQGTNAFGQGMAVTPLQMITAVATVANDGVRLRPHIVARRHTPDSVVSTYRPVVEAQVISPRTAHLVTEIMVRAVEEQGSRAQVAGYHIAGKTGTAQIPVPGGYDKEGTIASFVGFGPVPDPRLIILVKLDRPTTSPWASDTAVPTFQRLASQLFITLGIPPSSTEVAEAVTR